MLLPDTNSEILPRFSTGTACNNSAGCLRPGEKHRGDRRDPWAGVDLQGIFEKLGWRLLEIDGHDFSQIVPALESG